MSRRETKRLRVYDRYTPDFDILNSFDEELIEISSAPIKIFSFNLAKTVKDKLSPSDDLYSEPDTIDEDRLWQMYNDEFDNKWDSSVINQGEQFDPYVEIHGYYQEVEWTQELSRFGIEEPQELAIIFNYDAMVSTLKKEIKIGDVLQTFRGKIFRVQDAYVADEIIGWKYIHYHIIAKKPKGLDRLILPGASEVPSQPGGSQ